MILIPVMESMDGILSELSGLIDVLEKNGTELKNDSISFVRKLEAAAEKYRLPIASQLSVIRGKLVCGAPKPENTVLNRREYRALEKSFILSQLEAVNDCVNGCLEDSRRVFAECEKLACQVTVRLKAKGELEGYEAASLNGGGIMALASRDGELAPIVVHIAGLAGALNTKIIFDKTMSLSGLYDPEENQ